MINPCLLFFESVFSRFISLNPRYFQGRSRERQSHLESLHDFVSQATQELIWLNEKEEEEVAFDWSDRNSSISKKREYHTVRFDLFCRATFHLGVARCQRCFVFHAGADEGAG